MPTASWILTLHQVMNGTETKRAAGAHQRRQHADHAADAERAGRARQGAAGLGLAVQEHLGGREGDEDGEQDAQHLAGQRHARLRADDRADQDAGRQHAHDGHSTAPRWWCARTEDSEVKQMVASEVATAIFTV